jgi:Tfp pilus assembly protein PilO
VPSKRIYISVAISVVLLITWYFIAYRSQAAMMRALKSERESLQSRFDAAEARLKQAGDLQSTLAECNRKWCEMRKTLVGPDSIETMLRHLVSLAQGRNLTVLDVDVSFDPLLRKLADNRKTNEIDRINLDMSGRGRFFNIGDFVVLLENDIVVANVNSLDLTYQQAADPEIYFDMNMEIFIVPEEGQTL